MLYGEKVILREYRKNDTENVLDYINDFETKKFLTPGIPFPYKFEDELLWYEKNVPSEKGTYSMAIEEKITGEYLGGCGINSLNWKNSVAEIGIFIAKPFWNKGYGTDAIKLLIKFIFEEMNIHKVKLETYSFNQRAIRCYEKCGFTKEGILREELFREGKYHDIILMSILKDEYLIP